MKTSQEAVEAPQAPLRHLYEVVLVTLQGALGLSWGKPGKSVRQVFRRIRETVADLDGIHLAADLDHDDQAGLHIMLWVDRDDFDLLLADDIANEIIRSLGDREVLLACRSLEDSGIRYRFASGSVERGMTGAVMLVGPYAQDVSRLARIGIGQPTGFSA
ncbi:MAG TPA: hypothetical protein VGR22_00165 [Thermomicrobiales bacterium]|nr:hypothetical protein [Thermomicrobiales bacterium]